MPKIIFVQPDGTRQEIEAKTNQSVMEVAVQNQVPGIVAECTGACSCATCHVYVDPAWKEKTGKASEMEEDMLDFAVDPRDNSRLSCQIQITDEMDGLVINIPESQY